MKKARSAGRRQFLKSAGLAGAAAFALPAPRAGGGAQPVARPAGPAIPPPDEDGRRRDRRFPPAPVRRRAAAATAPT